MTNKATYLAAKSVSAMVEDHFSILISAAKARGKTPMAPIPEAVFIENLLDVAFWSSLRREEGHSPKISLTFLSPEHAEQPMLLEKRLPFNAYVLTKLAPGVERPGVHLGIWHDNDTLYIWGTTRIVPDLCFVLDVSEPGLLVIKHRRVDGFGKYANVAVLIGDQIKIVNEKTALMPDCPGLLASLLGSKTPDFQDQEVNVLVQLSVSMRAHGKGGALLIVPSQSNAWRESILHPIHYSLTPNSLGLAHLLKQEKKDGDQSQWQNALKSEVDYIAGFTAIDGATIVSDQYQLLAFGAKIGRPDGKAPIERIFATEPIVGGQNVVIHPSQFGGTRHLSAAQFIQDQQNCMALVASQDGRFTIFSWSPCENIVQAHRIDTLLL